MPTRGPNVPHRTPRSRALEIGTDSSGFGPEIPLTEGIPSEQAGGTYREEVDGVPDPGVPVSHPNPFRVG